MRLGELLYLVLDCLLDFASHGSWLKVPLGKLATERTVPLDEVTLAALDGWTAQRGPQRALPHPRHGQPTDFLFLERGRRLSAYRLRQGLTDAAAAAGLQGRDGDALHVTPHQLRHTYGTSLKVCEVASDASFDTFGDRDAIRGLGIRLRLYAV